MQLPGIGCRPFTPPLQELAGQGRAPFGVYITSPDYLGGMQDIAALSAVCDALGVPLLVDNAHGAYLRFLPGGGRAPHCTGCGRAVTPATRLCRCSPGEHTCIWAKRRPVQEESAVRSALALFGSTSPSYLILQSLDTCNRLLSAGYPRPAAAVL